MLYEPISLTSVSHSRTDPFPYFEEPGKQAGKPSEP